MAFPKDTEVRRAEADCANQVLAGGR